MTYGECENCWQMATLVQADDGRWICYGCAVYETGVIDKQFIRPNGQEGEKE